MVTKAQVMSSLKKVLDPELGVSVVDMGMVRSLSVKDGSVNIVMVLTSPFCPMASLIVDNVKKAAKIKGVSKVTVKLDVETPWDPTMINSKIRSKFGI